jgi:hypothetical protein
MKMPENLQLSAEAEKAGLTILSIMACLSQKQ